MWCSRRTVARLCAGLGLLVAVAGSAAAWLVGPIARPAAAAPLATICDMTGGSLRAVPSSLVLVGDAITGQHHRRAGFPADAIAVTPDPDGSPSIAQRNLQPVDLDGDGRLDLELALGMRASTAAETVASVTGATPTDALLTQNYGYPADSAPSGNGVAVTGLDLLVKVPATSWIHKTGHYAAQVQVRLERSAGGRVVDYLDVTFTIDSLQAAARAARARFPGEVRMSVAFRELDVGDTDGVPENDDLAAWVVGHEVVYPGVAAEDHGPLDLGTTVTQVASGADGPGSASGLVDVGLAWDRVPVDAALGVRQSCLQGARPPAPVAHYASNLPDPAPSGHDVALTVRSGLGSGLDRGDELRVEGRLSRLPRLVDLLGRGDTVDLVHSAEVAPDVRLDRLDLGVDAPGTDADEPIHAHGRFDGLPPHVRIEEDRDAQRDIAEIHIDACPYLAVSDGALPYVPVHAPTLAATGRADGCSVPAGKPPVTIPAAHLVVQNFLPDGPHGNEQSAALAPAPSPTRPPEEEVHYEQPVAGEAWRLVRVVRPAVARTTFVLAAAQHPHLDKGVDPDVLLVRVGADLTDVEALDFATEAGHRRPPFPDPGPDDRTTYGARDTAAVATRAAPELRAQVTLQTDRRTDIDDDQGNEGAMAYAHGTLSPLPAVLDRIAVEALSTGTVENRDTSGLRLDWEAPDATLDLAVVRHQSPGRDAGGQAMPSVVVDGEAELTAPDSGEVELAARTRDGRQRTSLTSRSGAADGLELRFAGRVTTDADRRDGRALRLATTARVAEQVQVVLERALGDRELTEAAVVACASAAGCDSDVHVDAAMGPDTSVPTLAAGVTPPAPFPPRPWVTPAPAEANDLTVVRAPADETWAAGLDLHDLVGLSHRPEPGDLCVRTGDGPREPLTALLQTPDAWFDGRLDALPSAAEAKLRFAPHATDLPMLWADSTSCDADVPPIDQTAPGPDPWDDQDTPAPDEAPEPQPDVDGPDGRPVLTATILLSPDGPEPVAALAEPQLAPTGDGVAVTAKRTLARTTASAVRLREWLPDHLLIWAPDIDCPFDCASPSWQRREHNGVRVRAQSTRRGLGALEVTADLARRAGSCRSTDSRWAVRTVVPDVPGNIDVQASLRTTARLCALDAEVDARGSASIGELTTTATDLAQPTDLTQRRTGYRGDAVGAQRTPVPELSLALRGAGHELHVTSRQRGFEAPEARPAPTGDLCPGHPAVSRGPVNVGYVDASIDLSSADGGGTAASTVVLDLVQAPTDPRGTTDARSLITVNAGRPVDAVVQTRLNNLAQSIAFTRSDPIPRGLGLLFPPLIGASFPGLAGPGVPAALATDALVDDAEFDACIDFDLPLVLTLTHTTTAQLAQSGVSFALDDNGAAGSQTALDVGEVLTAASGNQSLRQGAPYAYRSVDHDSGSTTTSSGVVTNSWKDVIGFPTGGVVLTPPLSCGGPFGPSIPYFPGIPATGGALDMSTAFTSTVTGTATARDGTTTAVGLRRALFNLDLLWDFNQRGALAAVDLAGDHGCPGVDLYDGIGALATPPLTLPVAVTPTTPVQDAEFTITQADAIAAGPAFCSLAGWSSSASTRPVGSPSPDYPVAVGADGTRYSLEIWTEDPNQTYCRINLVARHPGGALRWSRRIAGNAGPIAFWPLDWTVRILPRADDGSVELQLRQLDRRQGVPLTRGKVWLAVFDAGGNGEVIMAEHPDLGSALGLLQGVQPDLRLGIAQLPDASGCVRFAAAAPAPVGTTRVWWFGDGARYVDPPAPADGPEVTHCYGHTGDYYVQAVDFRDVTTPGGHTHTEVAGSTRFRIHVDV